MKIQYSKNDSPNLLSIISAEKTRTDVGSCQCGDIITYKIETKTKVFLGINQDWDLFVEEGRVQIPYTVGIPISNDEKKVIEVSFSRLEKIYIQWKKKELR